MHLALSYNYHPFTAYSPLHHSPLSSRYSGRPDDVGDHPVPSGQEQIKLNAAQLEEKRLIEEQLNQRFKEYQAQLQQRAALPLQHQRTQENEFQTPNTKFQVVDAKLPNKRLTDFQKSYESAQSVNLPVSGAQANQKLIKDPSIQYINNQQPVRSSYRMSNYPLARARSATATARNIPS